MNVWTQPVIFLIVFFFSVPIVLLYKSESLQML